MNTDYIYSSSRFATMGTELLSVTDIDRLLSVSSDEGFRSALTETYLGSYAEQAKEVEATSAIEASLIEARALIARIAPAGADMKVLWVQYDIHNLRVLVKATKSGLSLAELDGVVSHRGTYSPEQVQEHAASGTLDRLEMGWQAAYDSALGKVESGALDEVDAVFDELYFAAISRIAHGTNDAFLKRYSKAVIDQYNIMSALRRARHAEVAHRPAFVSGGTFAETELHNKDAAYAALEVLSPGTFSAAIAWYEETGNTSEFDAMMDDYLLTLAKTANADPFSSAALVLFYLRTKQAAANIRTIMVGRASGLAEDMIRANLHTAYVNQ